MNIFDYTKEQLEEYLIENGFKKYNATQVIDWIYKKKEYDFSKMSNISKKLISFLSDKFVTNRLKIVKSEKSKSTEKFLLELDDDNKIECVLMHHGYGRSLCISSQVGCNMGCAFCESGRLKKVRDLSYKELILQIITVEEHINGRVDSVVVMGIGEPFDNYDNIKAFIETVTDNNMIGIGQRHLTISTCGIVPKIKEFASLNIQVNLAVSLHAPNNEIRNKIMKINKAYKIEEVIDAIDYYIETTNRRVTIEYIMLDGINDTKECAQELSDLFRGKLVYINLIPYNETSNLDFKRSNDFKISQFYDILKKNKIEVTIRKEMGSGVSAACGQLRAQDRGEL